MATASLTRRLLLLGRDLALLAHSLQPRVCKIGGFHIDGRVFVRILENDGDVAIPAELGELLIAEAFVPWLDCVVKLEALQPFRQQFDESRDIVSVENPATGELPENRPKLRPKRGNSLRQEIRYALSAFAEL